jgi:ZIP family zinc transporter
VVSQSAQLATRLRDLFIREPMGHAALWGLLAASGLVIGALVGVTFDARLSHRIVAANMGFGAGILIAVLSVNLMDSAFRVGGPVAATAGFLLGATTFCGVNAYLARRGARHRNRCGDCVSQPSEAQHAGSGAAIVLGSVLDGIPESLVIGLSVLGGEKIGPGLVAGFFLANVPQGLSSAMGMKKAGRSTRYIMGLWLGVVLAGGAAASAGYLLLGNATPAVPATILAFAAGGVLAMLAESVFPESFENAGPFTGLIMVSGFLVAFLLTKTGT